MYRKTTLLYPEIKGCRISKRTTLGTIPPSKHRRGSQETLVRHSSFLDALATLRTILWVDRIWGESSPGTIFLKITPEITRILSVGRMSRGGFNREPQTPRAATLRKSSEQS